MYDIALGVLANILRIYSIYRFMELVHIPKKLSKHIKALVYVLFIVLNSGGYYIFHNMVLNIVTNVIGLCMISMLYQGRKEKKLVLILCIYAVNVIVESFVFSITGLYVEYDEMSRSIKECITSICIYFCTIALGRTCAHKKHQFQMKYPIWVSLLCIPIISIAEIFSMWQSQSENAINVHIEIIGVLIINIALFYLYDALQDYYKEKSEKEEFRIAMESYSNQLDLMKESWQKMRGLRHDLKHHLCELRYFATQNNEEKMLDYLDEMERHMINNDEYVSSGNNELDGTLNYLLQLASNSLKEVRTQISVPEEMEIHSFSLNVVLGNLLENAIKGARESERKYLHIIIRAKQGVLFIKIENSYNGQLRKNGKKLLSTKKESEKHGIGLENVQRIVNELNGNMEIVCEGELFCVNIMLFLNEKK